MAMNLLLHLEVQDNQWGLEVQQGPEKRPTFDKN